MDIKRKRMNFSLNTEIEELLKKLSKKYSITMSEIVRKAVENFNNGSR